MRWRRPAARTRRGSCSSRCSRVVTRLGLLVRGPGSRDRGTVGQLPADLQHGGHYQRGAAPEPLLGRRTVTRLVNGVQSRRATARRQQRGRRAGRRCARRAARSTAASGSAGTAARSRVSRRTPSWSKTATSPMPRSNSASGPSTFTTTVSANTSLWPICHYLLGFFRFERREFDEYRRVNSLFARKLIPLLQPTI